MKIKIGKNIFITAIITLIILCSSIIFIKNNEGKDINELQKKDEKYYSKTLNLAIYNFDTINPLLSENKSVIQISNLIFEPLIGVEENYKITYKLAKECAKISDTSYIVKLDESAQWQDGTSVTSKDVEFTVNFIKNNNSIYKNQVENITNIGILDELTFKINLDRNIQFFEYYLTFPILQKNMYNDKDINDRSIVPIGTGMYKISKIAENSIILEKNNNYNHLYQDINIDTIKILLCKNMEEIYQNFKIGNIDLIHTNSSGFQKELGKIGYNLKEFKGRQFDFLAFNCNNEILNDKEIRKAISYGINQEEILYEIYNQDGYIANWPIDFGSFIYKNENINNYDVEAAKKILEDSGWRYKYNKWQKYDENGRRYVLEFDLVVLESDITKNKVCEEIKNQLEQIGIIININRFSYEDYKEKIKQKDFEIMFIEIINGFSPCVDYFYGLENFANYKNSEVFEIINEINNIQDQKVLKEKYDRLIQITSDEVPYIGISRNKEYIILNPKFGGEIEENSYNIFSKIITWHVTI